MSNIEVKEEIPVLEGDRIILDHVDESLVIEENKSREDAEQAKPFKWRGKVLNPFAIDRESDWMLYRTALNMPDVNSILSKQPLAFLKDACAIVWFCSVDPIDWIQDDWRDIELKIRKWMKDNVSTSEMEEMATLGINIYVRAHSTQATVRPSMGGSESGKM